MKIIPAIDLLEGNVVRLKQGDYTQLTVYSDNPLAFAQQFEQLGFQYLHLVDLEGARGNGIVHTEILQSITSATSLNVDFGGGIKTTSDLELAFRCGANQVTAGSIAVKNPGEVKRWITTYGAGKIILGADVKDRKIAVSGWKETSTVDLFDFLEDFLDSGIRSVVCTDISKDGLLQGPAIDLYAEIIARFPEIDLIASGGVSSMADLEELNNAGLGGVIIGKALYENRITLEELATFNRRINA